MNKSDLKKIIKPLVKECIHEVLLEEGLLSNIVSEVAHGLHGNVMVETKTKQQNTSLNESAQINPQAENTRQQLKEYRSQLMDSIGKDAYNGVNLFEGTDPMTQHESTDPKPGAIDLGDNRDSGVDISSLVGNASQLWRAMK